MNIPSGQVYRGFWAEGWSKGSTEGILRIVYVARQFRFYLFSQAAAVASNVCIITSSGLPVRW
jgi:hypothetical protein